MTTRARRIRAHYHYLKQPIRNFLPLLGSLVFLLLAGSLCFHHADPELGYSQAFVATYFLIFGEPVMGAPKHWLLQLFHLAMPLLGLLVLLDGIVRFSYHILRRDETGPEWTRAMCKTLNGHVILCGLGKLGLRTLQQLLALGEQVAVLEKDPQCPNLAFAHKHGVPVRVGHSREEGVFDDLNIRSAKSIILCTNDDLANLEMAIDARKAHPAIRVILRMFDQELANRLRESMDMPLTFSTSELAAPLFATSSSDRSIINSFYVGRRLIVLARLTVRQGSQLIGKAVRELGRGEHVFVLSHSRNGTPDLFPSAEVVFAEGDQITVQTEPGTLKRIHAMNGDPKPC
jgi:Trk K+ transport system NAD-binding subunit